MKHLAEHDRNVLYICRHPECEHRPYKTYREEMSNQHHTRYHRDCTDQTHCLKQEHKIPQKKFWGCGICVEVFKTARSFADHHISHFECNGRLQKHDIKFSTMMQSLLTQDSIKQSWENYTNGFKLEWKYSSSTRSFREALEHCVFNGASTSEPQVSDILVDALCTQENLVSKRQASCSPEREPRRAHEGPSQSTQTEADTLADWDIYTI